MSVFGTNLGQSVAGVGNAERIAARESSKPREVRRASTRQPKDGDEVVIEPETVEAVRNLKDNTQEETAEDRQEHAGYRPDGSLHPSAQRRNLDLQG